MQTNTFKFLLITSFLILLNCRHFDREATLQKMNKCKEDKYNLDNLLKDIEEGLKPHEINVNHPNGKNASKKTYENNDMKNFAASIFHLIHQNKDKINKEKLESIEALQKKEKIHEIKIFKGNTDLSEAFSNLLANCETNHKRKYRKLRN